MNPDEIQFECNFLISTSGLKQITDQRSQVQETKIHRENGGDRAGREDWMLFDCAEWKEDCCMVRLWLDVDSPHDK